MEVLSQQFTVEQNKSWSNYQKFINKYWRVCTIWENAFITERTKHYKDIAEKNASLLEDLFGSSFVDRARRGQVSVGESRLANSVLADTLYSPEIANKVRNGEIDNLDNLYKQNVKKFLDGKSEYVSSLVDSGVAMILVRPEVYHIWEIFAEFLQYHKFDVVHASDRVINFDQYWGLYHHGLIVPDSWEDFPTRTLGYINHPCKAILFRDTQSNHESLADDFIKSFKGERGSYTPNTLRGDIVLKEMLSAQVGVSPDIENKNLVIDPINAYKHLISGATPSDNAHTSSQYPMLFYAGAGVHIPDGSEIKRDLSILFSLAEIKEIAL